MEFKVCIDHYHHGDDALAATVADLARQIAALSTQLTEQGHLMANELARLTTEVAETHTVVDSAIALITTLADLIRQSANSPAELTKLADDLDAKQASLAAAVAANTPAA